MAKFFLHIDLFSESTILGLRLQERMMDEFQHRIIDECDLVDLQDVHNHVLETYIAEGGKGRSEFRTDNLDEDHKRFSINKGIRISCTRIRGDYE